MARTANRRGGSGGLLNQVSGMVGKTGGRGRKNGGGGGGLPGRAMSFVAGFMSGGDAGKRKSKGRGSRGRAARRRR